MTPSSGILHFLAKVTGDFKIKVSKIFDDVRNCELRLKTNKLGYIVEGNVIRIAPFSELANEEAEKRRLAEDESAMTWGRHEKA